MTEPLTLTALYQTVEDGWVQARVRELPAVITAAPTRDEARLYLEDAVREYLLALIDPKAPSALEPDTEREHLAVTIGH